MFIVLSLLPAWHNRGARLKIYIQTSDRQPRIQQEYKNILRRARRQHINEEWNVARALRDSANLVDSMILFLKMSSFTVTGNEIISIRVTIIPKVLQPSTIWRMAAWTRLAFAIVVMASVERRLRHRRSQRVRNEASIPDRSKFSITKYEEFTKHLLGTRPYGLLKIYRCLGCWWTA